MQMLIQALLLAVLLPGVRGTVSATDPTCRAQLQGTRLTTTIRFEGGYSLAAPWEVLDTRRAQSALVVDLGLDRIIESDGLTGEEHALPLESTLRVTLQVGSQTELVDQAARTWCASVIQARGSTTWKPAAKIPRPGYIT